ELAGVARLQDLQLESVLLLERLLHRGRDRERVVRDEDDVVRLVASSATGDTQRRRGDDDAKSDASHELAPGRIARSTPCSTSIRAASPSKTFETPRLEPGSSGLSATRALVDAARV